LIEGGRIFAFMFYLQKRQLLGIDTAQYPFLDIIEQLPFPLFAFGFKCRGDNYHTVKIMGDIDILSSVTHCHKSIGPPGP